MKKLSSRILSVLMMFGALCISSARGDDTAPDNDYVPYATAPDNNDAAPVAPDTYNGDSVVSAPFISINTDRVLDMNWTAALEFTDPNLRPVPITLPFLDSYPIDNLEIKLRLLRFDF